MKMLPWKITLLLCALVLIAMSCVQARAVPGAGAAASLAYPLVDTGQSDCYNSSGAKITCPAQGAAFYGQDGQFSGNAAAYTLSLNGATVYDNVTRLTWERSPDTTGDGSLTQDDKLTYTNALAHCAAHAAANYQGYNDWRLPAIKELYSLITFTGTDPSGLTGSDTSGLKPFIDTNYFQFAYGQVSAGERIIDSQYASSSLYVDTSTSKLFGVNFADGRIKGYDLTMPGGTQKTFFVQCVRGNSSYGVNALVNNGDHTITDSATGLMWARSDSAAALSWQEALAWVATKNAQNYLGHNDWRLPNAKELQSIVDYTRSPASSNSAALDPIFNATSFTNEGGQTDWPWYWTSTTHVTFNGTGAQAIYLAFGRASGWQKATPTATCYTLVDVHGAGAQRSDPKTSAGLVTMGAACNGGTAYGLGPQGDVQRTSNYVRLVRDASSSTGGRKAYLPLVANTTISNSPAFTIKQTLSDGAQRDTIAFDGLAFITGSLGADSFFPPGKVADFWGFQYLRDNDPSQMGHNTDFLTRAALNLLYVLTPSQRAELITLANSQVDAINQYAYNRFTLISAFRRLLEGNLPTGSSGLDKTAVMAYSAQLYHLDGEISYDRARVMGTIISQFDATQRAYLNAMVGKGMLTWPVVDEPDELRGLSHDAKVAVMTYAGDMFSWYAGSLEADVYFCPERQGTYFGSFYMKDAPAVGNPNYTISSNLTAEMGQAFLKNLTSAQAALVTNLVSDQKTGLYAIVDRRQDVASLLRQFMTGATPDRATVLNLMDLYGQLDGDIVTRYATAFAQVGQSLSADQRTQLVKLRTDLLKELSYPTGAYLYAQAIPLPTLPDTDFLFLKN